MCIPGQRRTNSILDIRTLVLYNAPRPPPVANPLPTRVRMPPQKRTPRPQQPAPLKPCFASVIDRPSQNTPPRGSGAYPGGFESYLNYSRTRVNRAKRHSGETASCRLRPSLRQGAQGPAAIAHSGPSAKRSLGTRGWSRAIVPTKQILLPQGVSPIGAAFLRHHLLSAGFPHLPFHRLCGLCG